MPVFLQRRGTLATIGLSLNNNHNSSAWSNWSRAKYITFPTDALFHRNMFKTVETPEDEHNINYLQIE